MKQLAQRPALRRHCSGSSSGSSGAGSQREGAQAGQHFADAGGGPGVLAHAADDALADVCGAGQPAASNVMQAGRRADSMTVSRPRWQPVGTRGRPPEAWQLVVPSAASSPLRTSSAPPAACSQHQSQALLGCAVGRAAALEQEGKEARTRLPALSCPPVAAPALWAAAPARRSPAAHRSQTRPAPSRRSAGGRQKFGCVLQFSSLHQGARRLCCGARGC